MSSLCACHFVGFVMPLLTYWMKFLVYDVLFFIIPPAFMPRGIYFLSFRSSVHMFVGLYFRPVRGITSKFKCNQQNDLCAQRRLCTQWLAKSARFFMRTAKTDQTGQMPRLICVFQLIMFAGTAI